MELHEFSNMWWQQLYVLVEFFIYTILEFAKGCWLKERYCRVAEPNRSSRPQVGKLEGSDPLRIMISDRTITLQSLSKLENKSRQWLLFAKIFCWV